jgi:hypothetical protein
VWPAFAARQVCDLLGRQAPALLDAVRAVPEADLDLRLAGREVFDLRSVGEVTDGKRDQSIENSLARVSRYVANHG